MLGKLLMPLIEESVQKKEFKELKDALMDLAPEDLAELIGDLEEPYKSVVFRILPREKATLVFEFLETDVQEELLSTLSAEDCRHILEEMSPDDRTHLLEELPASVTRGLLSLLSAEERKLTTTLLGYPEDSVGRLMTPDFIELKPEMTAKEALEFIRKIGLDKETIYSCYVTDAAQRLIGFATLRAMVLAPPDKKIEEIMKPDPVKINVHSDQEDAVELSEKYDLLALPVIDNEDKLLGIVTVDDLMDVKTEEATEDMHLMAAVVPTDKAYLTSSITTMAWRRVIWLLALLFTATIAAVVLKHYSATIVMAPVLVYFVPVLIATGGNTGNQSATLVVRALALGELTVNDVLKVVKREIFTGLALGAVLSAAMVLIVQFFPEGNLILGVAVGLALGAIITLANLVGALLPIGLKSINLDPALMSNPFVSTIMDVVGLIIYFTIAHLAMPHILGQ